MSETMQPFYSGSHSDIAAWLFQLQETCPGQNSTASPQPDAQEALNCQESFKASNLSNCTSEQRFLAERFSRKEEPNLGYADIQKSLRDLLETQTRSQNQISMEQVVCQQPLIRMDQINGSNSTIKAQHQLGQPTSLRETRAIPAIYNAVHKDIAEFNYPGARTPEANKKGFDLRSETPGVGPGICGRSIGHSVSCSVTSDARKQVFFPSENSSNSITDSETSQVPFGRIVNHVRSKSDIEMVQRGKLCDSMSLCAPGNFPEYYIPPRPSANSKAPMFKYPIERQVAASEQRDEGPKFKDWSCQDKPVSSESTNISNQNPAMRRGGKTCYGRKPFRQSLHRHVICSNCKTDKTSLWRRSTSGEPLCNACGLFRKLHGSSRPMSLKTDVIRKRNRTRVCSSGYSNQHSNNTCSDPRQSQRQRTQESRPRAISEKKSQAQTCSQHSRSSCDCKEDLEAAQDQQHYSPPKEPACKPQPKQSYPGNTTPQPSASQSSSDNRKYFLWECPVEGINPVDNNSTQCWPVYLMPHWGSRAQEQCSVSVNPNVSRDNLAEVSAQKGGYMILPFSTQHRRSLSSSAVARGRHMPGIKGNSFDTTDPLLFSTPLMHNLDLHKHVRNSETTLNSVESKQEGEICAQKPTEARVQPQVNYFKQHVYPTSGEIEQDAIMERNTVNHGNLTSKRDMQVGVYQDAESRLAVVESQLAKSPTSERQDSQSHQSYYYPINESNVIYPNTTQQVSGKYSQPTLSYDASWSLGEKWQHDSIRENCIAASREPSWNDQGTDLKLAQKSQSSGNLSMQKMYMQMDNRQPQFKSHNQAIGSTNSDLGIKEENIINNRAALPKSSSILGYEGYDMGIDLEVGSSTVPPLSIPSQVLGSFSLEK